MGDKNEEKDKKTKPIPKPTGNTEHIGEMKDPSGKGKESGQGGKQTDDKK